MSLSMAFSAVLMLTIAVASSASAQNCNELMKELGVAPEGLADGATYVEVPRLYLAPDGTVRRSKTKLSWQLLDSVASAGLTCPHGTNGSVREANGRERVGVLVIKTGRFGPVSIDEADEVSLVRQNESRCAAPCQSHRELPEQCLTDFTISAGKISAGINSSV